MNKNSILGVNISNVNTSSLISYITSQFNRHTPRLYSILTVNPEIVVQAKHDTKLNSILNRADITFPDGIGIIWAGKILSKPFVERITGVELTCQLLKVAEKESYTVGSIGGTVESNIRTNIYLHNTYPKIKYWIDPVVHFNCHTYQEFENQLNVYFQSKEGIQCVKQIIKTRMLFVALGAPKQEYFINYLEQYLRTQLKKPLVAFSVGGTFDELNGTVPPCPNTIDQIGFKWLYRLVVQPWRIRRQLRLFSFAFYVFLEKFHIHFPNTK